ASARIGTRRRPPRPPGQLLRPAPARLVRARDGSAHAPAARAEDDGRRPFHAPPLHGLQPSDPDRAAPLRGAGEGTRTLTPPKETPDFKSGAYDQFRHPGGAKDSPEPFGRIWTHRHPQFAVNVQTG